MIGNGRYTCVVAFKLNGMRLPTGGAGACLEAGANAFGGTLMNESTTRAVGGVHGQEFDAAHVEALAVTRALGAPAYDVYGRLVAAPSCEIEQRSPPAAAAH
jgi:hypothetical protein